MRNIENYVNTKRLIAFCSLIILILLTEVPAIQRGTIGTYLFIPFILLLVLSYYTGYIRIEKHNRAFVFCLVVYFTMAFLYKFVGISTSAFGQDMHAILFLTFFLSSKKCLEFSNKQKSIIIFSIILFVLIAMISNIRLFTQLGSYRYFNLHRRESASQLGNLINTQYSSAIMLMAGVFLILFFHDKITKRKLIWIALFIAFNTFTFSISQRSTNIFLSVSMYIIIYSYRKENKTYTFLINLLIILVFGIILFNAGEIANILSDMIGSQRISYRLQQISTYFYTRDIQEAGGSLLGRYNLIMVSINTWLSSLRTFFFGAGDHISNNLIIGNHSQLVDVLAKYGIIGAFCLYYIIYRSIKNLSMKLPIRLGSPLSKQIAVLFIFFFIRGIIGGILYEQIGICLFVLLPTAVSLVCPETDYPLQYE